MQITRVLKPAFGQTLKSCPFVFKKITVYFGLAFFLGSTLLYVLAYFLNLSQINLGFQQLFFLSLPLSLAHIFLAFMVPYYAYHYNTSSGPDFWDFIGRKVWPLVLSQIKALFVILFFFLLLIVPGAYKAIRLMFLSETVFFDKKEKGSYLKKASRSSQGYFWLSVLFFLFMVLVSALSQALSMQAIKIWLFTFPSLILLFYVKSFIILFKNQLYFQIKKDRGEEISLS